MTHVLVGPLLAILVSSLGSARAPWDLQLWKPTDHIILLQGLPTALRMALRLHNMTWETLWKLTAACYPMLQHYGPSFFVLVRPCSLMPQGLCICHSFHLTYSFSSPSLASSYPCFRSLLKLCFLWALCPNPSAHGSCTPCQNPRTHLTARSKSVFITRA